MRGLYFLTTTNEVRHLDIMDKIRSKNTDGVAAEGHAYKSMSPARIDEENLPELCFLRREKSKDDSYLLDKHNCGANNDNELHMIE